MLELLINKRRLDLPIYSLSEKKSREKSCFIDHNRVDTVKSAKNIENKHKEKM